MRSTPTRSRSAPGPTTRSRRRSASYPLASTRAPLTRKLPLTVVNTEPPVDALRAVLRPGDHPAGRELLGVAVEADGGGQQQGQGDGHDARCKPSALRHTIDPTMETNQLGVPRQFVSDASGRVLVTPSGEGAARVPVYGAAKPVSAMDAVGQREADLVVRQGLPAGRRQHRLDVARRRSCSSARSRARCRPAFPGRPAAAPPRKSEQAGDLQYVGAGSSGDWLWFGLSTYADWAKVGTGLVPFVDFDTTGDGKPDYETVRPDGAVQRRAARRDLRPQRPEPRGRPAGELQLR